ncbi:MAG: TonB-dependent receptor [Thermoanaerobaculaceae bacterium]
MRKVGWSLSILAMTLMAVGVFAQTTGSIEGVVVDENNAPLPGVTVEASSSALQGTKVAVTDTEGKFRLVLLPPGTYTVKFSLSGFAPVEQTDVKVGLGRIVTLNVQMNSAFREEIVVSGAAPTIDTKSAEVGANLDKDFFLNLPVGRNYASVVRIAPGTGNDASGVTVYGSTGAENAYYIDGINTTGVELGTQGKLLNFEFIQEVQVKTGGYQAEFGRSTGGMINVITKSGGNEFHGDVFGYYDSDTFQAKPAADVNYWASRLSRSYLVDGYTRKDFGFGLGGYILKDTLWFYGSYDYVKNDEDRKVIQDFKALARQYNAHDYGFPAFGSIFTNEVERDLWSAKLTYRLSQNHSFIFSGFGDPTTTEGPIRGLAGNRDSFLGKVDEGGTDLVAKYEGVFGQNWVVNVLVGQHKERSNEGGRGLNQVALIEYSNPIYARTGVAPVWDGFGFAQRQEFERDVYKGDVSYFLNNLLGDHEFKFGIEGEHITVDNKNYNTGGQRIYALCRGGYTGDGNHPCGREIYYRHRFFMRSFPTDRFAITNDDILVPLVVDSKSNNLSLFLQDSWRLASNLTLNIGVRWEQQKLYDSNREETAKLNDEWAPRVGVIWDPKGDGTTKVFAHFGRFYETIPMDMVIRSFGKEITAFTYNYHGAREEGNSRYNVACDPAVDAFRRCSVLGHENTPVDPNLQGQYIDEAVVGGEYELMKDLAIGVKYIYRDLGRIIEDSLGFDQGYYIGNPGEGLLRSSWDMTYPYQFPVPDPKRIFKGVELTARKRFSNNWSLIASYLWSKLEGNYDGTFQVSTGQLDPNLNSAFDYAEFQVHNRGYLSNDRRHQFKVDGYYTFPFNLTVGLSGYFRDGVPITAMGYSTAYQNWEYYLSRRGAFGRTDDEWEADLHLDYPVNVAGVQVKFLADVFNLFNRQGEVSRNMRYDLGEDYGVIDYDTGNILPPIRPGDPNKPPTNPAFNTPNSWQAPRSVRFGVRVSF